MANKEEPEKSERLKMVEAVFGPKSPATLKLLQEIKTLELELELIKLRNMDKVVTEFSALPEPSKKTTPPTP